MHIRVCVCVACVCNNTSNYLFTEAFGSWLLLKRACMCSWQPYNASCLYGAFHCPIRGPLLILGNLSLTNLANPHVYTMLFAIEYEGEVARVGVGPKPA